MKYLGIFFILFSFVSFSQKEIFLQSNPEDRYVIAYTTGNYTLMFDYQDVLDQVRDSELKNAVKEFFDQKLDKQETVELNRLGQTIVTEDNELGLKELMDNRLINQLIYSGNVLVLDVSGKPSVNSIIAETVQVEMKRAYQTIFTDTRTGEVIHTSETWFRRTVCPDF